MYIYYDILFFYPRRGRLKFLKKSSSDVAAWCKILQAKEEQSAWPFPKQVNSMIE